MIVIDMGDEQRVEGGDVLGGDRRVEEDRHVEAAEHGVDHHRGAVGVEEEARPAEPGDGGVVARCERCSVHLRETRRLRLLFDVGADGLLEARDRLLCRFVLHGCPFRGVVSGNGSTIGRVQGHV